MSNTIEIARGGINAFNKKDWDAAKAICTSDVVYDEVCTHQKFTGIDQVVASWKGWAGAFPDASGEVTASFSDGDTAILQIRWTGEHTGELQTPKGPVPATNRSIDIRAVQVTKIVDGKIAHQSHYFDLATMMTQLGLAG